MGARSNGLSEITRFWLQDCHGLFLREVIPVPVNHGNSDIDFAATSPRGDITLLEPIPFQNAIIETKDERNFDPRGTDFTKRLLSDAARLNGDFIPKGQRCNYTMLKEEHHTRAKGLFGSATFAKVFVFHNLKKTPELETLRPQLRSRGIYLVTSFEMLDDIRNFFTEHHPGAGIRNSLVGDILDMLITYHGWTPRQQ